MSKLILKGCLAEKYGEEHNVLTDNLPEALRIVDANHPGFRTNFQHDGQYVVFKNNENIGPERLVEVGDNNTTWFIEPIPFGSKNQGAFNIILGVVLIAAGYFTGGVSAKIGFQLMIAGAFSILGGLASFLAPAADTSLDTADNEEDKSSYLFNGPTNKTSPGHARPICYGEVFCSTICIGYKFRHVDEISADETEYYIDEKNTFPWSVS